MGESLAAGPQDKEGRQIPAIPMPWQTAPGSWLPLHEERAMACSPGQVVVSGGRPLSLSRHPQPQKEAPSPLAHDTYTLACEGVLGATRW